MQAIELIVKGERAYANHIHVLRNYCPYVCGAGRAAQSPSYPAYSGDEVVLDLNGNVMEGALPKGKMRLLLVWLEIHRDELDANWELLSQNEPAFKIEPLK